MNRLNYVLSLLFLVVLTHTLAANNKDSFLLKAKHNHVLNFNLERPTRVTIIQYHGYGKVRLSTEEKTIYEDNLPFVQIEVKQDYKDRDFTLEISEGPAVGIILREVIDQFELISVGQEKMIDLSEKQSKIVEIHPRKFTTLKIQKFEGTVTFTNNRCLVSQKQDCFYELQRIDANKMTKYIQLVHLDACISCIVLIKMHSLTSKAVIRMSIQTELHVISSFSTVALLKKGEEASFIVYGESNQEGKVIHYSGAVEVQTKVMTTSFSNGHFYHFSHEHNYQKPIEITLKGLEDFNYVMMDGPSNSNPFRLKDGLPETFEVEPNMTYIAKLDKKGVGRGNFVLAGESQFLSQLYIRFINKELDLHYAVKPQFLFPVGHASQNFQLDNSTGIIELQIKNMGEKVGYLNLSASLAEVLNLPMNWKQSNILEHRESNSYVIDGIDGTVQVIVQKCVECYLQIGLGTQPENIKEEEIKERVFRKTFSIKDGHLYVRLSTNNYAFYSIIVQNVSVSQSQVRLEKPRTETYLTNPEEQLELEFIGPKCGENYCNNTKYYLIQGSNKQHVASRAYCPNALFDFDERTKDIVFEEIQPKQINESHFSYVRPLKHREWVLLVAKVDHQILSYDLINSGEIRDYNSVKWPIFYFILFLTFAIFISFVLFMALNRPKSSMGYLRGASAVTEEQIF